jgi:hypothetical protein
MEAKMSKAALTKYWMTACDEDRNVIFNRVVSTGSQAEAQLIAESYVPEQHHGSICITVEDGDPITEAPAARRNASPEEQRNAKIAELTEQLFRARLAKLGQPAVLRDVTDSVLDYLGARGHENVGYVLTVGETTWIAVRDHVMRAEAESDALKQIEAELADRAETAAEDRAVRARRFA